MLNRTVSHKYLVWHELPRTVKAGGDRELAVIVADVIKAHRRRLGARPDTVFANWSSLEGETEIKGVVVIPAQAHDGIMPRYFYAARLKEDDGRRTDD